MREAVELWVLTSAYYVFECIPGALVALILSQLVSRIGNRAVRTVLYAALGSIAIAPGVRGHLVRIPAIWGVVLGPELWPQCFWSLSVTWVALALLIPVVQIFVGVANSANGKSSRKVT